MSWLHPRVRAAARARQRQEQHEAALAALRRRASVVAAAGPVTADEVARRHVLQSDFGGVVGSPTSGWVEAEVVLTGDTLRIYTPDGALPDPLSVGVVDATGYRLDGTDGITASRAFTDADGNDHAIEIEGGIITAWTVTPP